MLPRIDNQVLNEEDDQPEMTFFKLFWNVFHIEEDKEGKRDEKNDLGN